MASELRVTTPGAPRQPAEGLSIERLRTIVQDSHLSLLVGAGTSVPFFEPLGDVENVLTALQGDDDATHLARASVQGYYYEKVLAPNLRLLDGADAGAQRLIKSYGRLMATLNRILLKRRSTLLGKQMSVFTTNVDMAFEMALELLEIDSNDGFTGKMRPRLDLSGFGTLRFRTGTRYEYRSEIPVMNLFKIHGSVGWRRDAEEIYFDHQLDVVRKVGAAYDLAKPALLKIADRQAVDADALRASAAGKTLDEPGRKFAKAYRKLQIVNPEKTKFASTVLNKTYYELNRRLANELERENSALLVHGFSFRDEHLLDLILRAAATNPTLQIIVFCYSRESHDEIRALFPDERVKNGNILLIQPARPEKPDDERKLSLDVVVEDFLVPILTEPVPSADHIIELKLGAASEDPADA